MGPCTRIESGYLNDSHLRKLSVLIFCGKITKLIRSIAHSLSQIDTDKPVGLQNMLYRQSTKYKMPAKNQNQMKNNALYLEYIVKQNHRD